MDRSNTATVPMRALSEFLEQLSEPVQFLKTDIEGGKWPQLAQLRDVSGKGQVSHVFVETHERFAPFRLLPMVLEYKRHFRASDNPKVSVIWPYPEVSSTRDMAALTVTGDTDRTRNSPPLTRLPGGVT